MGDGQLVDRATARVEVLADACVYSVTVSNTVAGWTGLKRPTTSRAAVGTMPAASGTDGFRFLPHPPNTVATRSPNTRTWSETRGCVCSMTCWNLWPNFMAAAGEASEGRACGASPRMREVGIRRNNLFENAGSKQSGQLVKGILRPK